MQSTSGRLGQAGIRTSIALTVSALALAACAPDNTAPASQTESTAVQTAGPAISETSIVMADDPGALGFSSEGFEKARADLQAGIDDGVIPGVMAGDILGHEFMGRVVETGTATELLKMDGVFRDLFQKQFGGSELLGFNASEV